MDTRLRTRGSTAANNRVSNAGNIQERTPDNNNNFVDDNSAEAQATNGNSSFNVRMRTRPISMPNQPEYYEQEYVLDKLVNHRYAGDGTLLFTIRWYGYDPEDDTEQPIGDIPRSKVLSYCKRRNLRVPASISQALPG